MKEKKENKKIKNEHDLRRISIHDNNIMSEKRTKTKNNGTENKFCLLKILY